MDSPILGRREAVKLAVQCSLAVAGTGIAASSFRASLNRIFAVESHGFWLGPIILSLVAGILWFALMLAFLAFAIRITNSVSSAKGHRDEHLALSFAFALAAALALAISAWLALEANDGLFYSRSLPWVPSLIWFQETGFRMAYRFFPCQYEGFDTGCEAYKTIPVFLISNAIAYLPFSLALVLLTRYWEPSRLFLKALASAFLRRAIPVGIALLCLRLVFFRLFPHASLPIASTSAQRTTWSLLEWTVGPISVALALSIPFVFYGAVRAVWRRACVSERLADLTRVALFVVAALILGNQYQ